MALRLELKRFLDNTEEPLVKRLKLADNVYKYNEFPINGREILLIKWFCKVFDVDNLELWQKLHDWVTSEYFKNLNRNEVSYDDFNFITDFLKQKCETNQNVEISNIISKITVNIIENEVFHQFFKLNYRNYCVFVSTIIKHTSSEDLNIKLVTSNYFLHKNFWPCKGFHKLTLEIITSQLIEKLTDGDDKFFLEVSKILQKSYFMRNGKVFEKYFQSFFNENTSKDEKYSLPKAVFKFLVESYQGDEVIARNSYKLIFHAICLTYNRDFNIISKFFAFSILQLGFDCSKEFNFIKEFKLVPERRSKKKSLNILLPLLGILSETRNDFMSLLGKVKFSDFLRTIISTVIQIKETPDEICFKIFEQIIQIHPMSIEPIIDEIIVYIMLPKHESGIENYERLLISLMQVFMKLHRVENFLTKLMATLNEAYRGNYSSGKNFYEFLGSEDETKINALELDVNKIFPERFLDYLTTCIISLQSGDVIILYKSLLKELNASLEIEGGSENGKYFIFIEVVSVLLSRFLASVRIAEHTVPLVLVKKFLKVMEEQKLSLSKFGSFLLSREHDHVLMRSFLKLCNVWADLYIILIHYSSNRDLQATKHEINENMNITDFHTYLKQEQWCLISERINNFGEEECKEIMQRLYIQKFKALTLFQPNLDLDKIKNLLINGIENSLEDIAFLINDKFCANVLLEDFNESIVMKLSEDIVDKSLEDKNYSTVHKLANNVHIMCSVLRVIMNRINTVITKKNNDLISVEIYSLINEDELNVGSIEAIFENHPKSEGKIKINQKLLNDLFNIIKSIPVIYLPSDIQSKFYLYFCGLLFDFKYSKNIDEEVTQNVEDILFGMMQNGAFELGTLFKPTVYMKLIGIIGGYKSFYKKILQKAVRDENDLKTLKKYVKHVSKDFNEIILNCAISTLKFIYRLRKEKRFNTNKADLDVFANQICENISDYINNNNECPVEVFGVVLNHFLSKNDDSNVDKLRPHLNNFIAYSEKEENIKNTSCLLLFHTLLLYKSKFVEIVNDDFLIKIWKLIKETEISKDENDIFPKLLGKICYDISLDNYKIISKDLLDYTATDNEDQFMNVLKIWEKFLDCDTDSTKKEILIKTLEELLFIFCSNVDKFKNPGIIDSICQFLVHLIQSQKNIPTSEILDLTLIFTSYILKLDEDFITVFNWSMSILEALLSYRKVLICDCLPSYFQEYRSILKLLCKNCDSNEMKELSMERAEKIFDSSYRFLKLTRYLCQLQKHVESVAMYLIADILQQYEVVTLLPNVKTQLNYCVYEFIALCNQHSIKCLMRTLSGASTETFKLLLDTYKKYYKFTGKV